MPEFPSVSSSQEIGQDAGRALQSNSPRSWLIDDLSGDNDFGYDYFVQVVDDGVVKTSFKVQLKGSRTTRASQDGRFSVPLKSRTLNLYRNSSEPVLLLFADLSADSDPRKCPVYYQWIHSEVRKILNDKEFFPSDQKTHAFHVPKLNRLSDESHSKILNYLLSHGRSYRSFDALHTEITRLAPGRESEIYNGIKEKAVKDRNAFIDSILFESLFPWSAPEEGSVAFQLKTVHEKLEYSDDESAAKVLFSIAGSEPCMTEHEKAEFHYQMARVALIQNRKLDACSEFEKAHSYKQEERYLIGLLETRLALTGDGRDKEELIRVLESIPDTGSRESRYLKSVVLSLLDDFSGALQSLDGLDLRDAATAKAKIYLLKGDWKKLEEVCSVAIERGGMRERDERLLRIFLSRALFIQAFDLVGKPDPIKIPPYGTLGMDTKKVLESWEAMKAALDLMKQAGWPIAVEYLLDMVAITAQVLERQHEVLPIIKDLVKSRSYLHAVNETLAQLAITSGDRITALEALNCLPEDEEVLCKRALANYDLKNKDKVVELGDRLLPYEGESDLYPASMCVAALSSDDIIHPGKRSLFLERLDQNPQWQGSLAVARFVIESADSLKFIKALDDLRQAHNEYPESVTVSSHLFMALDATNKDQANECIELASAIQSHRLLGLCEELHLGQAFLSTGKWDASIQLADQALLKYGDQTRFHVLRAFALDKEGDVVGALESLDKVLKAEVYDIYAYEQYISIASRCGLFEEAKQLVSKLYQQSASRENKLDALGLLFNLEFKLNPGSSSLKGIADELGKLVKSDVEEEEGLYLQLFIAATLGVKEDEVDQEEVRRFQERLRSFTEQFPDSRLLRQVEVPNDGEGILRKMRELTGMTPEIMANYERNERQMQAGDIASPFIWRPSLLPNIRDVAYLWELSKASNKDARQYHLLLSVETDRPPVDLSKTFERLPLLDLPTLLLLEDLDLLGEVISLFGRIAVPKIVVAELTSLSHPFSGTFNTALVDRVLERLRSHLTQVRQPGDISESTFFDGPIAKTNEILEICKSDNYFLYSDDAVFRMYVAHELPNTISMCSLDMLEYLELQGRYSCRGVSKVLARLCDWNVGIIVQQKHFLAAIPDEIFSRTKSKEILGLLKQSDTFILLSDAIWDFRLDFVGLVRHIAHLLSYLTREGTDRADIISAIWQLWAEKIQFNERQGAPPLMHLANSFVLAGSFLRGCKKEHIVLLWSAYRDAVEALLGPSANEKSMKQSLLDVAILAAKVAHNKPGQPKLASGIETSEVGGVIIETLSSGLLEGTQDYDDFMKAYSDKRIELAISLRDG